MEASRKHRSLTNPVWTGSGPQGFDLRGYFVFVCVCV